MEDNVNQWWLKTPRTRCAKIPNVSLFLCYIFVLAIVEVFP